MDGQANQGQCERDLDTGREDLRKTACIESKSAIRISYLILTFCKQYST